jgi:uncharacterized protein YjdB
MKDDLVIKIVFIITLVISIFFIISGLVSNKEVDNTIYETGLNISTPAVTLEVGETLQVEATVVPENATYKNINWETANPNIATVNNGLITGVSVGNTSISVYTEKMKITRVIPVTVKEKYIRIESINVKEENITIHEGDKYNIEYTILPEDATNKNLTVTTSDKNIAALTKEHEIYGYNEGTAVITLTGDNVTATINVTVEKKIINVSKVELDKKSLNLEIGKSDTINATISPNDATDQSIVWSSSDNSIATVDSGKITALKPGVATITATSNNGKTATCKVTVSEPFEKSIVNEKLTGYGTVASCNSDSMKYRIVNVNGNDFVLIWVKDPGKQLYNALAVSDGSRNASADSILSREISSNGYQNKCMIATNASFFNMGSGSINANIIMHRGQVVRNKGNTTGVGITKDGKLIEFVNQPLSSLQSSGIQSSWAHSNRISPRNNNNRDSTNRTIICQVNKNNFVMVSGSGSPEKIAYDVNNSVGGAACFNLDGGGSRKLYYKTGSSSITKRFGGGRNIPDMVVFVEQ